MTKQRLKIATRKSPLALWQANHIKNALEHHHSSLTIELLPMSTQGDKILDSPLAKIGGKGLFVKELEQKLLDQTADIAVHSIKDLPMELPEGLFLSTICEREDPRDAFIANDYTQLDELPQDAIVGTSSLRRECQLRALRPDLRIKSLRGNVNTRLAKLDQGDYDAIILAAAGVKRLKANDRIKQYLEPEHILPAVGQGAIGIECRVNDQRVINLLDVLNHQETTYRIKAERAMNHTLNGGCQVPIAGHAILQEQALYLRGLVGNPDGKVILREEIRGPISDAEELGKIVGEKLLQKGADKILKELLDESH